MTSITGPDIQTFQAKIILKAMTLYLDAGIRVNRAYTPKAMRQTAERITGKRFTNLRAARDSLQKFVEGK